MPVSSMNLQPSTRASTLTPSLMPLTFTSKIKSFLNQRLKVIIINISFSSSYDYNDELAWGAAWLYKATGEQSYLDTAEQIFNSNNMCNSNLWFGWDNKVAGVQVLMYDITGQDPAYEKCVGNFLSSLDSASYTPKGLIFVDNWGSNRHAGNNAHLCAQLANMGYETAKCDEFVDTQS